MFSEEEERRHSRGNINSDLKDQMLTRYVNDQYERELSRGGGGRGEEGFSGRRGGVLRGRGTPCETGDIKEEIQLQI